MKGITKSLTPLILGVVLMAAPLVVRAADMKKEQIDGPRSLTRVHGTSEVREEGRREQVGIKGKGGDDEEYRRKLKERMAKLAGGVATINEGESEVEVEAGGKIDILKAARLGDDRKERP